MFVRCDFSAGSDCLEPNSLELLPGGFSGQSLWVWIPYQGSQPRDSEQNVLLSVEDSLADIEGLKNIGSSARSGSVQLQLDFSPLNATGHGIQQCG